MRLARAVLKKKVTDDSCENGMPPGWMLLEFLEIAEAPHAGR